MGTAGICILINNFIDLYLYCQDISKHFFIILNIYIYIYFFFYVENISI